MRKHANDYYVSAPCATTGEYIDCKIGALSRQASANVGPVRTDRASKRTQPPAHCNMCRGNPFRGRRANWRTVITQFLLDGHVSNQQRKDRTPTNTLTRKQPLYELCIEHFQALANGSAEPASSRREATPNVAKAEHAERRATSSKTRRPSRGA